MAATVWKGHLSFGLVSIPVRLIRAARAQRVPLRQLYRPREQAVAEPAPRVSRFGAAGSSAAEPEEEPRTWQAPAAEFLPSSLPEIAPVKRVYQPASYERADSEEPIESIPNADLVKGFEPAKGQFVVIDEQELRQIAPKTSTEVEILEFVRFSEIDPVYLETSYFVVPEPSGEKAYSLLFGAMKDEGYAAIANVSMHRRDHVLIVRAGRTGLVAHTMFYADEVRTLDEFHADVNLASQKELDLAKTLIHALAKPFEPDQFKNQFREQLTRLIESRTAEYQIAAPEPQKHGKVIDIMDALKRSLAQVKPAEQIQGTKAEPQRKPARVEQPAKTQRKKSTR